MISRKAYVKEYIGETDGPFCVRIKKRPDGKHWAQKHSGDDIQVTVRIQAQEPKTSTCKTFEARIRAATRTLVIIVCTYLMSNLLSVVITIWEYLNADSLFQIPYGTHGLIMWDARTWCSFRFHHKKVGKSYSLNIGSISLNGFCPEAWWVVDNAGQQSRKLMRSGFCLCIGAYQFFCLSFFKSKTSWRKFYVSASLRYLSFYVLSVDSISLLTIVASCLRLPIYITCQPLLRKEMYRFICE
uniref:SH2 domain-containing protein n=1 Tax=Angiostrongylus cantonensis TaxID=6313 RepID=A0A0K0DIY4_ANGCA